MERLISTFLFLAVMLLGDMVNLVFNEVAQVGCGCVDVFVEQTGELTENQNRIEAPSGLDREHLFHPHLQKQARKIDHQLHLKDCYSLIICRSIH